MTVARRSTGIGLGEAEPYKCAHEWPEDCFVQCGDGGLVLKRNGESYRTAFFEAFPRSPETFIRGDARTVEEAEAKCWAEYQRYLACPGHEFEARGYRNGGGICRHCGMFGAHVIPPNEPCQVCGKLVWWGHTIDGRAYCQQCEDSIPDSQLDETHREARETHREAREMRRELRAAGEATG